MFSNMPKIYVPMMWFRQTIKLSKSLESLGVMLQFLKKLGYDVGCVLIVVGLLLIGIKVVKQFSNFTAASDTSQLLEKQEKEESESSSDDKN